jgi:hypothetical protein
VNAAVLLHLGANTTTNVGLPELVVKKKEQRKVKSDDLVPTPAAEGSCAAHADCGCGTICTRSLGSAQGGMCTRCADADDASHLPPGAAPSCPAFDGDCCLPAVADRCPALRRACPHRGHDCRPQNATVGGYAARFRLVNNLALGADPGGNGFLHGPEIAGTFVFDPARNRSVLTCPRPPGAVTRP